MLDVFLESVQGIWAASGFANVSWQELVMIAIACVLDYLAIAKGFEPLLLLPIAFGMLLTNIPVPACSTGLLQCRYIDYGQVLQEGGLLDFLYLGVKLGIYPPLIFLGIGCMTDFGPLIANPKSFLLGAAAQLGIFITFIGALASSDSPLQKQALSASSAVLTARPRSCHHNQLAPDLLGPIAVAAYSYMALVPIIQPPIMKLFTTKKERCGCNGAAPSGFQNRKDPVPDLVTSRCFLPGTGCRSADRYADARQPVP